MSAEALRRWERKLDLLREDEAIATDASVRFKLEVDIAEARAKIAELKGELDRPPIEATRVDVTRLQQYAPASLIGREDDMKILTDAWADACAGKSSRPRVVSFVALGGEGKTALVAKWLMDLASADWPGAAAVFAWSFYSQGTSNASSASPDIFLSEALIFFGDAATANSAKHAEDKARRLLQLLRERRTLLVLDGLEPLQYPPSSPLRGQLKDRAVATLLKGLAAQSPGLCVVTTRYAVKELEGAGNNAKCHPIKRLSTEAGASLLKSLGVHGRAGDLNAAVEDVRGHALTLNLLGRYLRDAYAGDVRRRDQVRFEEADNDEQGGHAFRVMDRYVAWFETDQASRQALALLFLMGLFDRPATAPVFAALLHEPMIDGLTDEVARLSEAQRNIALTRLETLHLLTILRDGHIPVAYDAHPLVREYFAQRLKKTRPEAWRAGHCRIFEHLCAAVEHQPTTLERLQPLYQAVAHGCLAGLHQKVLNEVYVDRILRGANDDGYYSIRRLGAFGADLGAVACFFDPPWNCPNPTLPLALQSWTLSTAAFYLGNVGRVQEALEPTRAALEMALAAEAWAHAASIAGNLSRLALALGEVVDALVAAKQAVHYADRSGDTFLRMGTYTTLADALHQVGLRKEAAAAFQGAEALQAERQSDLPLLYSLQGYLYCDLLLAPTERAAWRCMMRSGTSGDHAAIDACETVTERGKKMLKWRVPADPLLDIALDRLSLGRAALYRALLDDAPPDHARALLDAAVDGLRRAGQQDHLARGLLSRAFLRTLDGCITGPDSSQEDLDEAWDIAEPGSMRLFMADVHLHRARLFARVTPYPWQSPQADLKAARTLIKQCSYNRRLDELTDAEILFL